jgi:hypothetical protein
LPAPPPRPFLSCNGRRTEPPPALMVAAHRPRATSSTPLPLLLSEL